MVKKRKTNDSSQPQLRPSKPSVFLLTPKDALKRGLCYVRVASKNVSPKNAYSLFRKFFGCSPIDTATLWHDLVGTLEQKDQGEKGFFQFMMAQHFLWAYPKNADILANTFSVCEKYARGNHLWSMIKAIAKLMGKKLSGTQTSTGMTRKCSS